MRKLLLIYALLALVNFACGKVNPKDQSQGSVSQSTTPTQTTSTPPIPPTTQPSTTPAVGHGALNFGGIPKLPPDWWQNATEKSFETWDKNTLYLWGANPTNYMIQDPKLSLGGDGLAGPGGPTRGQGHPNYVGVITTSLSKAENDAVFAKLALEQAQGKNILVPIAQTGRWALGTGIALSWFNNDARAWKQSQYYLLDHIYSLALGASKTDFGANTFWPDCSLVADCAKIEANSPQALSIKTTKDLQSIKNYALSMSKNELAQWKFRNDAPVQVGPEKYFNATQKAPNEDTGFSAFTLVLVKNDNGTYEVLTQKRSFSKALEAPGGHLRGGQTWQEGAVDELEQEAGIALAKQALIYLTGGNNSASQASLKGNANFLVVFAGIKPKTAATSSEIDPNYGHQWLNLKTAFKEISDEEARLGKTVNGKYWRFFRGHVIGFCEQVVKNLGICE